MAAAAGLRDLNRVRTLVFSRVELGVEIADRFCQIIAQLVENIAEYVGVDFRIHILDFHAKTFAEGHRPFTEETAAGGAKIKRGEAGDLAQARAKEIPHGFQPGIAPGLF